MSISPAANPRLFRFSDSYEEKVPHNASSIAASEFKVQKVTELGNVTSTSTFVERDLGFYGKLGPYILLTYGDTMFCTSKGFDTFRGMTCNSAAFACEDPTKTLDPILDTNGYPQCFLRPSEEYGENITEYSLGITNVIEIAPGKGIDVGDDSALT